MHTCREAISVWALLLTTWVLGATELPAATTQGPAAPIVACSAEHVTVAFGETVTLRAWAETPSSQAPRFAWQVPVGSLGGAGGEVRWNLSGVRPGSYAASVRTTANGGTSPECLLRVIIRQDAGSRGGLVAPAPSRETGTSWLLPEREEVPEYGLYSYLLLGSPPTDASRERYLKTLEAFWGLIPEIARLEQYIPRRELNIAYLPLRIAPEGTRSPEWLLANYDFARARSLLRFLPGNTREGPYIISALKPMGASSSSAPAGPWLFQNLSRVPPHLVASWVKEFLNQAAQERFWEEHRAEALARRLRLTVGILSLGLPEVRKGVDDWIAWVH